MLNPSIMSNELVRRIIVSGNIDEDSAQRFLEQITILEHMSITDPITIYVDTYGGSIHAANLIHDAIRMCPCPITTVGIGKVMSSGVLILSTGDPGFRNITKNTRVMIHNVSGGCIGTSSELNTEVDEINYAQEIYCKMISEYTGQSTKQIKEDMGRTTYMSAEEAVKYGIADNIVPFKKIRKNAKAKTNIKKFKTKTKTNNPKSSKSKKKEK